MTGFERNMKLGGSVRSEVLGDDPRETLLDTNQDGPSRETGEVVQLMGVQKGCSRTATVVELPPGRFDLFESVPPPCSSR